MVSDPIDPAIKRLDFLLAQKVGQTFRGMNLLDFPLYINLFSSVLPSNAWDIFRLFINMEMVTVIICHTNEKVS